MIDMDAHRAERAQEKTEAVGVIAHALAKIEGTGREPDLWERELLRQAVSWLYRGGYQSATVAAAHALIPENQRWHVTVVPVTHQGSRAIAAIAPLVVHGLFTDRALSLAAGELHPQPIVLTAWLTRTPIVGTVLIVAVALVH